MSSQLPFLGGDTDRALDVMIPAFSNGTANVSESSPVVRVSFLNMTRILAREGRN